MRNEHLKVKNTRLYFALLDHYNDDTEHLWDDIIDGISEEEMNANLRRLAVKLEEKGLIVDEVI